MNINVCDHVGILSRRGAPVAVRKLVTNVGQLVVGKAESSVIRQRVIRAAGGLISLRMAFSGLSFLTALLLARLLGATDFGAYSYSFAWIVFLGIPAILGMDQLMIREVAASLERSEWGQIRGLLRHANLIVFLASASLAVAAGAIAWHQRQLANASTISTFLVALPFLPLITLTRVRQGTMQGLHRVELGTLPEQLIQPALFLLVLVFAWQVHATLTPAAAMAANVAAAAVAFAVGSWLLYRYIPVAARKAAPIYRDSDWARSALPLMFVAGVTVLFGQADTLILGAIRGTTDVGIYTIAHKSADFLTIILTVQGSAFASTAAGLYRSGELQRLQALVTRLARWTLLASLPIAIGLIFFGHWFLRLYGTRFVEAQMVLAIMAFGQLGNVSMGCVGTLLVMTGHERRLAKAIGIGALSNVILSLLLAQHWGAQGVAVAYAISMLLWNVFAAVALYQTTGLSSTALGFPTRHSHVFTKS
jgi:O-antigen/teichoic acid export membrane protein